MVSEEKKKVIALFEEGRVLYKERSFGEAIKKFAQALKIDSDDGPSKVYYARCKHYMSNPPSEDWDGVFVMTSK
ncbi:tetratricopeptide repeat protein [Spirochaeta isovalerica]|uniref:Tetratricopeptide (TPR) repeat protein n=1 Tax=Spirochaeta isovalerica TaxID=150 RepID=A0A841RDB1_9SPIO|nr:tetratricopeptide repeat protein [Spirochaeta isovalerica]MBB6480839.1 tetratricopeptide (TPR) repeat protein [Spirochaeta isovalerica]